MAEAMEWRDTDPNTTETGRTKPGKRVLVTGATGYVGGRLYWFGVLPVHGVIFAAMARRITRTAEAQTLADAGLSRRAAGVAL